MTKKNKIIAKVFIFLVEVIIIQMGFNANCAIITNDKNNYSTI